MSKKDLIIQFGRSGHKQADLLQAIASGEKEFEGVKVSDMQGLCDSIIGSFVAGVSRDLPICGDVLSNSLEFPREEE